MIDYSLEDERVARACEEAAYKILRILDNAPGRQTFFHQESPMRCAQTGCEISPDTLEDMGVLPEKCPICNHPLILVMTRQEAAEALGLPLEEDVIKTTKLPEEDDDDADEDANDSGAEPNAT